MTFGRLTLIWAFILCNIIVNTSAQTNKGQGIVFVVEIGTNHSVGPNVVERTVEVLETRLKAIGAQYEVLRSRENNNQVLVKVHSTNDFAKFRGLFQNHSLEIRAVVSRPIHGHISTSRTFRKRKPNVREVRWSGSTMFGTVRLASL